MDGDNCDKKVNDGIGMTTFNGLTYDLMDLSCFNKESDEPNITNNPEKLTIYSQSVPSTPHNSFDTDCIKDSKESVENGVCSSSLLSGYSNSLMGSNTCVRDNFCEREKLFKPLSVIDEENSSLSEVIDSNVVNSVGNKFADSKVNNSGVFGGNCETDANHGNSCINDQVMNQVNFLNLLKI